MDPKKPTLIISPKVPKPYKSDPKKPTLIFSPATVVPPHLANFNTIAKANALTKAKIS